jgi:ATP-dependent DNA helicase RecG
VEISNPGELLFYEKDLGRRSVARNPIIFDVFHRLGLIEEVGPGIVRILNETHERGVEVDFDLNRFFTIIIRRPVRSSEYGTSWRKPSAEESLPKSRQLLCLNEQVKLSDTDIKILTFCSEKPHSKSEILEELGYKLKSGSYKKIIKEIEGFGTLTSNNSREAHQSRSKMQDKRR